ncbi:2Fe-2S iron-sulfur cluster-binding protein [Actinacidiphila sp. bgisy144]|uniref:(2Fe-2S)-binding protein n=1 Tax=Actinacidiphila sp. bgisy144 TaxID=3413791 RepID=UPI003EB99AF9
MTDQQPNELDQREQQEVYGPGNAGAWQPVPGGGDYDPDQTMHVSFAAQLPPEPRPGEDPLGAHGPAGPGWSGQGGYQEDGGYRVSGPLFAPGPDDGGGYGYPPQEHTGPHTGQFDQPHSVPEQPYEHQGGAGYPDHTADGTGGTGGTADTGGYGDFGGGQGTGDGAPAGDSGAAPAPSGGAPDPATTWSIPVIREDAEAESGEYSLGAFSPAWDQTPSPAPTHSFPAGMFGQGAAAAAQAAQERAAAERVRGGAEHAPSDGGSGHWDLPYTVPEGGDAVPWLPAHAPASDAAWSGIVDDPEAPPAAPPAAADPERPAGHDTAAGSQQPYVVPQFGGPAAAEPPVAQVPGPDGYGEVPAGPEGASGPDGAEQEPGRGEGPDPAAEPAAGALEGGTPASEPAPTLPSPDDAEPAPAPGSGDAAQEFGADSAEPAAEPATDAEPVPDAEPVADPVPGPDVTSGADLVADPDLVADLDQRQDLDPAAEAAAGPDPVSEPDSAAEAEAAAAEPAVETRSEHPLASYMLRVNGTDRPVTDAWLGESLLYVLRERLGLAGAKDGCEQGECGACSVQVDGRLVASCLVPAATAAGSEVRTVEGLTVDGRPSDVQCALADSGAVQCGFCIPGMAMTVHDLLEGNHHPTDLDIRQALSGNLCRCSGYRGVIDAVRSVVAERDTGRDGDDGAAPPGPDESARIPHQSGPATSGGDR